MGVRRAVDMVLDAANRTCDPICTYGPLIHNPQVLNMLQEKGIPTMTSIPEKGEGTVLIRAHGIPPDEHKALQDAGFTVINATCPRVIRVQTIIRKHANKGFITIIVGDKDHPEVKGLMGYANTDDSKRGETDHEEHGQTGERPKERGYTISSVEEVISLTRFDQAIVVAQTTQDTALYDAVKHWISENHPHYKIFDTICNSTEKRQAETRRIAQESDAVVVVGGKDSGNTRRLAQIAAETVGDRQNISSSLHKTLSSRQKIFSTRHKAISNRQNIPSTRPEKPLAFAVHIEDVSELDMAAFASVQSIAITAGASTPNWIINQTRRAIEHAIQNDQNSPGAFIRNIRNFMLRSNFFLAAGAGSLTHACSELQGIENNLIHALIAMLYVLSMQILNNLFSIKSDRYNNPERAEFYSDNKIALAAGAIASGGVGLFLSFTTGILPFVLLCFMSLLGLLYNQKVFPDFLPKFHFGGRPIIRIKDIPGSKTILIAVAWGTVTSILPALSTETKSVIFIIPFVFATSILFARTAFFAILEMQGDRITGKETIPILLGEKKSQRLIQNILLLASATLFLSALSGLILTSGILIAATPLMMLYVIKLNENGKVYPGMNLEFIIESHFIIAGIITIFF